MKKPNTYLEPLCETHNKCNPLACCTDCHICMKAQYYNSKSEIKSALRDYLQVLDFFEANAEERVTLHGAIQDFYEMLDYFDKELKYDE